MLVAIIAIIAVFYLQDVDTDDQLYRAVHDKMYGMYGSIEQDVKQNGLALEETSSLLLSWTETAFLDSNDQQTFDQTQRCHDLAVYMKECRLKVKDKFNRFKNLQKLYIDMLGIVSDGMKLCRKAEKREISRADFADTIIPMLDEWEEYRMSVDAVLAETTVAQIEQREEELIGCHKLFRETRLKWYKLISMF